MVFSYSGTGSPHLYHCGNHDHRCYYITTPFLSISDGVVYCNAKKPRFELSKRNLRKTTVTLDLNELGSKCSLNSGDVYAIYHGLSSYARTLAIPVTIMKSFIHTSC